MKTGGESAFSVIVHLASADLELDRLAVFSNHRSVQRLVAVGLRFRDIIFDSPNHRLVHIVQFVEYQIASVDIVNDNSQRDQIINIVDIGDALHLLVQAVGTLDAAVDLVLDFLVAEARIDSAADGI